MAINRDESEQDLDSDLPVVTNDDGAVSGDSDDAIADSNMVPIPAELIANLPPEILATFPPEIQAQLRRDAAESGVVMQHFSASTSMSMMLGSIVNPVAAQVNSQHITDIIGITGRELDYEYSDRKQARIILGILAGIVICGVFAVALVLIFQGILDFLLESLKLIVPIIGGIGVGIAVGFRMGFKSANSRGRR